MESPQITIEATEPKSPTRTEVGTFWAAARLTHVAGAAALTYFLITGQAAAAYTSLGLLVLSLVADGYFSVIGTRHFNHVNKVHSQVEEANAVATAARNQLEELLASTNTVSTHVRELFGLTDMLQSAEGYDDATAVLTATSLRLMPHVGGSLYVFNNSRDRLDLTGSWNMPEGFTPSDTLSPSNCWALKRGKPHLNDPAASTLCCDHHSGPMSVLDLPMMARGSVFGLLTLVPREELGVSDLPGLTRLGQALADSMSLALSNISLREKLRTQSLRDPLTGLYNRRYMEDALERYLNLGERAGSSTAVVMIDLDNFKKLNDDHGHAKGDAVLRDVAAQIVGGLRPSDIPCRYGGEELLIILPNCSLEDAMLRAEALRIRVESLSEVHQAPITASFGVAAIPETSAAAADLVPTADNALYQAKSNGKNRVESAKRRPGRDDAQPRLVVTQAK